MLEKDRYVDIHNRFIHNSPKLELTQTQIAVDEGMDQQLAVRLYSGVQLSNKKEHSAATGHSGCEFSKSYAEASHKRVCVVRVYDILEESKLIWCPVMGSGDVGPGVHQEGV